MTSNLNNDIYIIENGNKMILYSLQNQAWIRINKNYIQSLEKEQLYDFLNRHYLSEFQKEVRQKSKNINSIYVFLTRKCNMKCSFCSMHAGPFVDISNELKLEELIGFMEKIKGYHIGRIIISGGEPLLSEKLYPLIDFISKEMKGTEIILQTNGTLITQEFCRNVKGKINRINISIESIYDIWSAYKEDFIDRLNIVYAFNIKMEFSFVVTKMNKEYIFDYIELCRKYNAEAGIKIVSAVGGEKRFDKMCLNEREILDFYKSVIGYIIQKDYVNDKNLQTILGYRPIPRKGCSAYSMKSFSILPEGSILRCHSIISKQCNQIATVKDKQISIRNQEKIDDESNIFSVDRKIFCKTCEYRHFCTGICSAEVYNCFDETFYKPDSCEWKKILIAFYLWDYERGQTSSVWEQIYNKINIRLSELYEKY